MSMLQLEEMILGEKLSSFVVDIERWKAQGPLGQGEIIFAPKEYIERVVSLPQWGPFPKIEVVSERAIG